MNKQEFLNTLRIIFKKANVLDVKSIIDVYEEHFAVGYEKGLNDEQIIKSLGTPKEIYTSYVEAGIITDEIGPPFPRSLPCCSISPLVHVLLSSGR